MMNKRFNRVIRLLIVVGILSCVSCNSLRVYVSDKIPPSFTFNVGRFAECCTDFKVFAVFEEGSDHALWKIVARDIVYRNEADSLVIHYGTIPDRFVQEIPQSGPPPQLVSGKQYLAVARRTSS